MIVAFSPHTDDAVFSVGAWLSAQKPNIRIVSPMAGVPEDDAGRRKHVTLRSEHWQACEVIGAEQYDGDFLDDVYPAPQRAQVKAWMQPHFEIADTVLIPLGLHHPDHLLVSNLLINLIDNADVAPRRICFYEELPYRVDHQALVGIRFAHVENMVGRLRIIEAVTDGTAKRRAVACYKSQTGGDVINRVMVRERIWELIR